MKFNLKVAVVISCLTCSLNAQEINNSVDDAVFINGNAHSYRGGLKQFCLDTQTIMLQEAKRLEAEKSGKQLGISSNDVTSSIFRFMGLYERIGEQRVNLVIAQCS